MDMGWFWITKYGFGSVYDLKPYLAHMQLNMGVDTYSTPSNKYFIAYIHTE